MDFIVEEEDCFDQLRDDLLVQETAGLLLVSCLISSFVAL